MPNPTYADYITRAIQDFDSIFGALVNKQLTSTNALANDTISASDISTGAFPTSSYAALITNQLFSVGVPGSNNNKTTGSSDLNTHHIDYYGGTTVNGAQSGHTVLYGAGSATLNIKVGAAGYYDTNSTITTTLTTTDVLLSGATPSVDAGTLNSTTATYEISSTNSLLGVVSVSKGNIEVGTIISPVNGSSGSVYSSTASLALGGGASGDNVITGASTISLVDGDTTPTAGKYYVGLTAASTWSADVLANVSTTFTPGYITNVGGVFSATAHAEGNGSGTTKMIEIDAADAEASFSGTTTITPASSIETATSADGYEVTASVTIPAGTVSVNPGYLSTSAQVSASATVTGETIYIKKGSLGSATANADTVTIAGDLNFSGSPSDGKYSATLIVNKDYTKTVESGYISNTDNTFAAKITGSKTIEVAQGSVSVGTNLTVGASGTIVTDNSADGAYPITVSATSAPTTPVVSPGYVKSTDVTATGTNDSTTVYVAHGSVTASLANGIQISVHAGSGSDGYEASTASGGTSVNIFSDTADATADYYELSVQPRATVSKAGYVTGGDNALGATVTKYLRKATLQYVQSSTNAGSFIQVTEGGYLPSGLIADISGITSTTPDYAEVTVTPEISGVFTSATADALITTWSKSVNAGYISENDGSLTVEGANLPYAHFSVGASATATVSNAPTRNTASGVTYDFAGTGSAKVGFDLSSAGYIDGTAFSDGNHVDLGSLTTTSFDPYDVAGSTPLNFTLSLGEVALRSSTAITAKVESSAITIVSDSSSGYEITASVDASKVEVDASTAGYLATGVTKDVSLTTTAAAAYVKKGTQLTTIANVATDTNTTLTTTENGDNTLTVSSDSYGISVNGSLTEGYYKGTDLGVSGTATVAAKTTTVAAAVASVANNATLTISSASSTVAYQTSVQDESGYVKVVAVSSIDPTVTVSTHGYLKDASQISTQSVTASTQAAYIKKFSDCGTASSDTITAIASVSGVSATVNTITVGDDSAAAELGSEVQYKLVDSDQSYTANDTYIKLGAYAMGSEVVADMNRLKLRLAGSLTS